MLLDYMQLGIILLILIILCICLYKSNRKLRQRINDLISEKQSLSVKHGKMTEQFIPFLTIYPFDKQNFRFIGSPIDGVQFEKDKIIFIEFKTGNSNLSEKQLQIKQLVEHNKVEFEEIRI